MIQDPNTQPLDPEAEPERPIPGETVDLDLDSAEGDLDLQALADQVADVTPELPEDAAGDDNALPPQDEVLQLLNQELEQALEEARVRIQELEKREADHMDKHHRLLADFANYRNRTSREIQMAVDLSEKKLLLEMLPVVDNFERCLNASYQNVEDFHGGVELIRKQFLDALRRIGAEPVDLKVGDPFNAAHAEALSTTLVPDLPDQSVAAIYERGYMLRKNLLRPARVVVNHIPETAPEAPPDLTL